MPVLRARKDERQRAIAALASETGLPVERIAAVERAVRMVDIDEILNLEDDIYRIVATLHSGKARKTAPGEARRLS